MRGFNHATILSPIFHGLRKERLAQWPAFCDPKFDPKFRGGGGLLPEKLGGGVLHASRDSYPISDQTLWFSLPNFRPEALRVTGARDKLLRQVHGSWSKH